MSQQQNWFARHKVLTGAGALVVVIAIGGALAGGGGDDDKDKSKDTVAQGTSGGGSKDKTDKPKAKPALGGDGTFQVGSDVKPGTYMSTDNTDGMCYWERAKDSSGETDSLIANDNVMGNAYVTIKASDKIFKSNGCKDWEAVPAKASGTPKSEASGNGGMYRIGADLAPGTYKSTGNADDATCYWERSKDALHGIDSIIANENVSGNGLVTIAAGDGYFKTNGCKNWKKTS
ncbi:hypothetical protein [Streptomyces sp. ME19-01-6]|uniref:hypothetical protein n=1 Tax=Streptomyces sp. ME19-01-6 TaxID=3028686 RepID=UPI0029BE1AD1|nr:hypothetical protein [Streptomyces sp. ME19-01-6]MDX3230754.1 hypothetical protein [Streptomyces sp. ME19-01-6]